jgi:hypothetical protein
MWGPPNGGDFAYGDKAVGQVAKKCQGTRKGKTCEGNLFVCANPECRSEGCERSGCDNRQFTPIQKCKDCGRSYERIQQFDVDAAPVPEMGPSSSTTGAGFKLPNVELLFGGILGVVALVAAIAGLMGLFGDGQGVSFGGAGSAPSAPQIASQASVQTVGSFTDVCQCYRQGMTLAGTGVSVLSPQYRTGFVQCRAVFGPQGGEAWTAGWTAREQGKVVAAGCRSWLRGVGR